MAATGIYEWKQPAPKLPGTGIAPEAPADPIEEVEGFWDAYREITRDLDMHGKHVPDAHLAALLKVHGIRRLYTRDADFRRYRFLDVVDPLG